MALMNWAIDVPQKLLQSDAKPFPALPISLDKGHLLRKGHKLNMANIIVYYNYILKQGNKEELIIKKS